MSSWLNVLISSESTRDELQAICSIFSIDGSTNCGNISFTEELFKNILKTYNVSTPVDVGLVSTHGVKSTSPLNHSVCSTLDDAAPEAGSDEWYFSKEKKRISESTTDIYSAHLLKEHNVCSTLDDATTEAGPYEQQLHNIQLLAGSYEGCKAVINISDQMTYGNLDYPQRCSTPNAGEVVFNYITPPVGGIGQYDLNTPLREGCRDFISQENSQSSMSFLGENFDYACSRLMNKISGLEEERKKAAMHHEKELSRIARCKSLAYIRLLKHQMMSLSRKREALIAVIDRIGYSYVTLEGELERAMQMFNQYFGN